MQLVHDFQFGLFFFQAGLIILLILILKKYAWGPILNAIETREDNIKDALEAAEKARAEMDNLKSENEKMLKKAREERDGILKEARQIKENMIAEASDEAEEKADAMISKAKTAIQSEKQSAIADIKAQMSELSISIAEKVVKKELADKDDQMKLVDDMLKDVTLN